MRMRCSNELYNLPFGDNPSKNCIGFSKSDVFYWRDQRHQGIKLTTCVFIISPLPLKNYLFIYFPESVYEIFKREKYLEKIQ